jgi:small-conductance mechanosensitive channel
MHRHAFRLIQAALLFVALGVSPLWAQDAVAPSTLSPAEARRAAEVLQDPHKREEAIRTLHAIAAGAPAPATASSAPAAAATGADAAAASTPAATAPTTAAIPLQQDGLIARMLRHIGQWEDGLGSQFAQLGRVVGQLPAVARQTASNVAKSDQRDMLLHLVLVLTAVFVGGLVLQWGLLRLLARPRRGLVEHADDADTRARAEAAESALAERTETLVDPVPSTAQAAAQTEVQAGVQPAVADVALIRTQRDGVEQVEAVPVAAGKGAAGGPVDGDVLEPVRGEGPGFAAEAAPTGGSYSNGSANSVGGDRTTVGRHVDHWRTLRHLPFALATLLLDLLPVAVFFLAAGLLLRWMNSDARVESIVSGFVDAYVTACVSMAVLRLLVSPVGHGLRLIRVGEHTAHSIIAWFRAMLIVGTAGFALANALQQLGASDEQRLVLIKAVSLTIHVLLVILLFRVRRPVAAAIAGPRDAVGPLATVRHWLAQVWAVVAAVIVLGAWFVWAMGVEDGFPKLLHFVGVTAAVVVCARIVAVLVLGGVSHLFQPPPPAKDGSDNAATTAARKLHAQRYYPLVRTVVTGVLIVCSIVALLQVWGVDALSWFSRGTIGRSLASALVTILVAATIAVLVWEVANASVEHRLTRWKDAGDLVRAARLRTLLPMLRTGLLVVIVLIVGLTVLNQIGVNTTPLLAGASIIGVALGFGSQKLVQDFITGIFLLMENAMQVGDTVTVGDVSGTVEYLSIRTVRLRGGDGSLYIVPFSSVTTVNNTNRGIGNAAMRVSVVYGTDVARAIGELKAIGASLRADPAFEPQILNDMEVWGVDAVDGGMFTIAGQISCTDKGRWGVQRELNRRILERFRELGIVLSNPRTSLLLEAPPPAPTPGSGSASA